MRKITKIFASVATAMSIATVGLAAGSSVAAHASTPAVNIIPALYAYPTDSQWNQIDVAAGSVGEAIVNICDAAGHGPGCDETSWTSTNSDWTTRIATLERAGETPLVYIPTNYGALPLSEVEGWISDSVTRYGVASPFFDEMAPNGTCNNGGAPEACTTYYNALYTYAVTTEGASKVMFNTGSTYGTSAADMFGSKEILQVFEGPATTQDGLTGFESTTWPSWMSSYPASQFDATIAAGTVSTMATDVADAVHDGIGNIYENDEAEPYPPYNTLPSFWGTSPGETADAASGL